VTVVFATALTTVSAQIAVAVPPEVESIGRAAQRAIRS
jgi:hypothetical protein